MSRSLENIPDDAIRLAKRIARGDRLSKAIKELRLTVEAAQNYVQSEWWPALVRQFVMTREEVEDKTDTLVPLALEVEHDILAREDVDLKLKADVANRVLKRRGYGEIERKQVEVFVFSESHAKALKATYAKLEDKA